MTGTPLDQAREPGLRSLAVAGIWLASLVIALHPVSGEELWWELSRGRTVVAGSWQPTAVLISASTRNDPDWLGGVIPYAVFETFGASGLMGLKIVAGVVLTRLLIRRISAPEDGRSQAILGIGLLATLLTMHSATDPGPVLFDVLGFIALFLAIERWNGVPRVKQLAVALLLLICWANFGPRIVVGFFFCIVALWRTSARVAFRLGLAAAALVAVSLTPAGVMTLRDSLIQTWPGATEHVPDLQAIGWHPWWTDLRAAESMAFVLLSLMYLLELGQRPSWQRLLMFVVAHILACFSAENLPLAALALMLTITSSPSLQSLTAGSRAPSAARRPKRVAETVATVEESPRWQAVAYAVAWLWVGWTAMHPWTGCEGGVGWGLDPRLNPEAFAASVAGIMVKGSAHCVGVREAGLLAWHMPKGPKPYDTPIAALLNHRLREHVRFTEDLSRRWQTPHRRADGTWGGWWQTRRERDIQLLIVPAENRDLITALEPSIWKPCSLNAVSLVYGVAGDPGVTTQIVRTLGLRQMVDLGTWTYQPASESASSFTEIWSWPGRSAVVLQSLRLAQVFRAMEMHYAALKVLHALPQKDRPDWRKEFFANQLALGYRERILSGRSSEFRLRTSLADSRLSGSQVLERLNWPADTLLSPEHFVKAAASRYLAGEVGQAADGLPEDQAESLYAKALLLVELGDPTRAQIPLRKIITNESNGRTAILVRNLLSSLGE